MFCFTFLLLTILLKAFVYLFLLFVVFIIGVKIWADPAKAICKCTTKLNGKVALITGGNSGIGLETARDLARRGARVIIASRNTEKSEQAVADMIKATGNTQIEQRRLDLSKFKSVREFAENFNRDVPRLDILVNNAGCAGKSKITEDGLQIVMQINYFGAVLLTNLLMDKLKASQPSRIVVVSSVAHKLCSIDPDDLTGVEGHKKRQPIFWKFYCRSKLLQVLWTRALAKRLPSGVTVNALHPGVVQTPIFDQAPRFLRKLTRFVIDLLFKTPVEGAQTMIHLCVATELENASGGYYANCKPSPVSKVVKDEDVIEKVWSESMKLIKDL